jgi:hypothetical protein
MPSTSKKQHNFMAAVAKNPRFAKRTGVPQSVGEDYMKADKGRKFGGGGMKASIANPQTRRGKMQMPNAKIRKYAAGGDFELETNPLTGRAKLGTSMADALSMSNPETPAASPEAAAPKTRGEAFKAARANKQSQFEWPPGSGNMYHTRTAEEEKARKAGKADKGPAPKSSAPAAAPRSSAPAPRAAAPKPSAGPAAPRYTSGPLAGMRRDPYENETPAQRHERLVAQERSLMASRPQQPMTPPRAMVAPNAATQSFPGQSGSFRSSRTYGGSDQRGAPMVPPRNQAMDDYNQIVAAAALKDAQQKQLMQQMGGESAYAKGGAVESKKMMKKEINFMKKKGAPKSMLKHEMAEAKGMNMGGMAGYKKGGMAGCYADGGAVKKPYKLTAGDHNEKAGGDQEMKMREDIAAKNRMRGPGRGPLSRNGMKNKPFGYARGGGIESKGKGAGTMIKMASGGSVSARADGVATKGKTKCKMR